MSEERIMDGGALDRCLRRMAHEIGERNPQLDEVRFIGIQTRGVPLARRLAKLLAQQFPGQTEPPVGQLDISFHRDDQGRTLRIPKLTEITFEIKDKNVILVDDVIFSGRTVRAALNALTDFGSSRTIQMAVLVDRGHRCLPIHADYVGREHEIAEPGRIVVRLTETDGADEVLVRSGKP